MTQEQTPFAGYVTEDNACWPADATGPCHDVGSSAWCWVEPDLCSACVGAEAPPED